MAEFYCRRKQADGEQHSNQVTAALTCVKCSDVQRKYSLSSMPFLLPRKNKPNKITRNCLKLRSHAKASLIKTGSIGKNVLETGLPDLKTVKTTRNYHGLPWIRSSTCCKKPNCQTLQHLNDSKGYRRLFCQLCDPALT